MSSIIEFLRKVYPDFSEARKARREIRQKYRKNLKAVDRGDDVSLVMTTDNDTEHLTRRAETAAIEADHLIKKHGSQSDPYLYNITSEAEKVEEAFQTIISKINRQNRISFLVEFAFISFVILSFALSISIGSYGVESVINVIF